MRNYSMEAIRKQIIGNNLIFDTPFGKRHLLYADYTASGRGLRMIEEMEYRKIIPMGSGATGALKKLHWRTSRD